MNALDARTRRCLAGWGIIFLVFIVYSPAIRGNFLWLDEMDVTENPVITAPHGLWRIWISGETYQYWPLTFTTFWIGHKLWGFHPVGYHILNISFHAIASLLFWSLLVRLKIRGAWVAAAIFALHPVEVESVAWIAQLKNVQSGIFYLASIIAYLHFEGKRRSLWYCLSLLLFLAALLSKTSTVMLPVALLLCLWWQRRPWRWTTAAALLPFFIISALMAVFTIHSDKYSLGTAGVEWSAGFAERTARAGWIIWFYLVKMILPFNLTHVYPLWSIDPCMIAAYFPTAACLIAVAVLVWKRNGWGRPLLMGLGFFAINLFPVLGFFNTYYMRYSLVADHWQYISSMGVIALLAGLVAWAIRNQGRVCKYALAAAVIAGLGIMTWSQAHIYRGPETLWLDTLRKNPRAWVAHNNLGNAFAERGRFDEAEVHYRAAIRIKPDDSDPYNNYGNILSKQGRIDEAITRYREAISIEPDNEKAHYNLGFALAEAGKDDEAVAQYLEALRIDPENAKVHNNLAVVLTKQGKLDEAVAHYSEALRIMPDDFIAHTNIGVLLLRQKKTDDAIAHLREALRIRPDFPYARENLGRALERQRHLVKHPRATMEDLMHK